MPRRRSGQDEASNSIPPTTSTQPPRPVSRHPAWPPPESGLRFRPGGGWCTDDEVRISLLEESVIVAYQLWQGEIKPTDPGYDYLLENLGEEVERIYDRRPDYRPKT